MALLKCAKQLGFGFGRYLASKTHYQHHRCLLPNYSNIAKADNNLLKSGKQITGLSRSQQQLGFGFERSLTSKTYHHLCLRANYSTIANPDTNNESEVPPKARQSFKDYFSTLVSPTPGQVLMANIMEAVEKMKSCGEENPPVDEIRPLYHELLLRLPDESLVKVLHELSTVGAYTPNYLILWGYRFKDFLDELPKNVIPLIQGFTAEVFEAKYKNKFNQSTILSLDPTRVCVTAYVHRIEKDHLDVFVVGDHVVITGIDKDDRSANRSEPTPKKMFKIPGFPYHLDKVEATIDHRKGQLCISFYTLDESATSTVINMPKVYPLKLKKINFKPTPKSEPTPKSKPTPDIFIIVIAGILGGCYSILKFLAVIKIVFYL